VWNALSCIDFASDPSYVVHPNDRARLESVEIVARCRVAPPDLLRLSVNMRPEIIGPTYLDAMF